MRQQGFTEKADRLDQNKTLIKHYLRENKWTRAHITGHQWFTDENGATCYGPQTDDLLSNSNGVCITVTGRVYIAHWDQDGHVTFPYIYCDESEFEVRE